MLILTRRPGESIEIGGNIKVTVLEIRGKLVMIRIEAPPELHVLQRADRMVEHEKGRSRQ